MVGAGSGRIGCGGVRQVPDSLFRLLTPIATRSARGTNTMKTKCHKCEKEFAIGSKKRVNMLLMEVVKLTKAPTAKCPHCGTWSTYEGKSKPLS
jgi:hypothetical protein